MVEESQHLVRQRVLGKYVNINKAMHINDVQSILFISQWFFSSDLLFQFHVHFATYRFS